MPSDIVVVLDQSGSMAGQRFVDAVAAVRALIGRLRPGHYADVLVLHGDRAHPYESIVAATAPDGRSVVLKIGSGRFAERLLAEHAILTDLEGVAGVARALGLEVDGAETVLVLEGHDETDLRSRVGHLDAATAAELGVQLAGILADVHQAGVVHRDVKPANVLISRQGALRLIDFGLSTSPSRTRADARFEGTLAYMAPEQTGRMDCDVDARADLYALGVTLFELVTGRLPFERDSPLDYVQAHLALRPPRADEVAPMVPATLADIIDRLLRKDREHRYQTAAGVRADLAQVVAALRADEAVPRFALGRADRRRHLAPGRLVGREAVVRRLMERVLTLANRSSLTLLIGEAGIGKSSVVDALRRPVIAAGGLLFDGKFEQYRTVRPFSAFGEALDHLARQILGEPDALLARWTEALQTGLGPLAAVLVELAPRFGALFGPVVPLAQGGPDAARNRVRMAVERLMATAASMVEGPLVFVIDDLQWADAGSLLLLGGLLGGNTPVAVVTAARPATPAPWEALLAEQAALGRLVETETVEPLTDADIAALVADLTERAVGEVADLARLTADRSENNPLLARQFLTFLVDTGRLRPHPDGGWQWRIEEVLGAGLPETLAETLAARLDRLSGEQLDVLCTAACVGLAFEPHLVFELLALPRRTFDAALGVLREQGLLTADARSWRFAHDRIQEAALRLLGAEARARLHRRIGQHLLAQAGEGTLFTLLDHLNQGGAPDDPEELARLNLVAGKRALDRGAWQAAAAYLQTGLSLVPGKAADGPGATLRFELALERAQAAYLIGEHADADARFQALLAVTTSREARLRVAFRRVVLLTARDRMVEALATGLAALNELGLGLPTRWHPVRGMLAAARAWWLTRISRSQTWLALPRVSDPESAMVFRLMSALNGAAYAIDKRLFVHLLSRTLTELRRRGRSSWAGIVLSTFTIILLGMGRHAQALALIDVALQLGDELPPGPATRLAYAHWMFARPWQRPLRTCIAPMRAAARGAMEAGDIEYALLLLTGMHVMQFFGASHLGELETELGQTRARLAPYSSGTRLVVQAQMQRCVGHLTGTVPLDAADLARGSVPGDRANIIERRLLFAIPVLCVFGCFDDAVVAAGRIRGPERLQYFGLAFGPMFAFYAALAHLCAGRGARRAHRVRRRLEPLAARYPENFRAFALCLDAELARHGGRHAEALAAYGQAANEAGAQGNRLLQGLIEERWASLYAALGLEMEAHAHLHHALSVYAAWGAAAKVAALTAAHPGLAEAGRSGERRALSSRASTSSLKDVGRELDMATVWSVTRELSNDLRLGAVVEVLLHAALHNAGATAGVLALSEADGTLRAVGRRSVDGPHEALDAPLGSVPDAPGSLMRFVARTREPVVLEQADEGRFDDEALRARPHLAVLCVPLSTRDRDVGVLYLENDRVVGAFTGERIHVLQLIGMQAAVSLTNARLHQATEQLAQTLEQRVLERTAELAVARDLALEATRAKSAFLAAMSHEIRTPMNGLLGTAQLLADTRLDGRQKDYVDIIGGSASALLTVLNDILDFSKIEAGKFDIESRPFSLRDTVEDSAHLVSELAERKGLVLTVRLEGEGADRVIGDGARLRQVLLNLVNNAIKFTERGGVTIWARRLDGDAVRFEVQDTGIGIRPDHQRRLFQPFSQADDTISRRFGGTGLGLAISKRLIELMGGQIGVESAVGRGSKFWFELPLPPDTAAPVPSAAPERLLPLSVPAADRPPPRVLVVEDNLVNQKITRWMLEKHGYHCVVVGDGVRALEAHAHAEHDIILMDCQMPEMDGLEATRRLRARGCRLPIIALSAGALDDERAACQEAGMDDFIAKPIKMPELLAVIEAHLARAAADQGVGNSTGS
ncbi:MAG: AAA family ATPase [Myxococcales bacterium]|nr:AAA family ATPase [Myxococcales bacterium]